MNRWQLIDTEEGFNILTYNGDESVRSLLGFWVGDDLRYTAILHLTILFIQFSIPLKRA